MRELVVPIVTLLMLFASLAGAVRHHREAVARDALRVEVRREKK